MSLKVVLGCRVKFREASLSVDCVLVVVCSEVYRGVGAGKSKEGNSGGGGTVWAKTCGRCRFSTKWSEEGGVFGEGELRWKWSRAGSVGGLAKEAACGTLTGSLELPLGDEEDSSENDG